MAGDDRIFEGLGWIKRFRMAFNSRQGDDYYEMMRRISRWFVWPRRRFPTEVDEVFVSGAGEDDYAADGRGTTASLPYLTIEAAMREAIPGKRLTIRLAAGYTYNIDDEDIAQRCDVYLIGDDPDDTAVGVFTGTTTQVQAKAYNAEGIYEIPADGVAEDAWRGALVKWSDGIRGVVYKNAASTGGVVRFHATQDRAGANAPVSRAGVAVSVYTPSSLAALRFVGSGNPTIRQASRFWLENLRLRPATDGATNLALIVGEASTTRLTRCVFLDEWQRIGVFEFGSIRFHTCFFAMAGANATFGNISLDGLGRLEFHQGCAWDNSQLATPQRPIGARTNGAGGGGANFNGSGHVWRDVAAGNVDQEVIRVLETHNVNRSILLVDCEDSAFTVNLFRNHARGVFCEFPDVFGVTSGNYAARARQGHVRLGPNTSLTTALGVNVVCCVDRDGVAYRVARDDRNGTLIEGGDIAPQWPGSINVETLSADKVLTWGDAENQRLDPGATPRTVDLPGRASGSPGREWLPLGAGSFWIYNAGSADLTVRWDNNGTPTTVTTLSAGQGARFAVTESAKESRVWAMAGKV